MAPADAGAGASDANVVDTESFHHVELQVRAMLPAAGIDMRRFRALSHGEVWNFQDSGSNAG